VKDAQLDVRVVHSFRAHFPVSALCSHAGSPTKTLHALTARSSSEDEFIPAVTVAGLPAHQQMACMSWHDCAPGMGSEPQPCDCISPGSGPIVHTAQLALARVGQQQLQSSGFHAEHTLDLPRSGMEAWEMDPHKVLLGHRLAVGGFAEVFVGKYEVRAWYCMISETELCRKSSTGSALNNSTGEQHYDSVSVL
jgi:hypothetical protein